MTTPARDEADGTHSAGIKSRRNLLAAAVGRRHAQHVEEGADEARLTLDDVQVAWDELHAATPPGWFAEALARFGH